MSYLFDPGHDEGEHDGRDVNAVPSRAPDLDGSAALNVLSRGAHGFAVEVLARVLVAALERHTSSH